MAARVLLPARVVLFAGPTVLAFFAGGFFDEPHLWAGLVAWMLVAIAFVFSPEAIPRRGPSRMTLLALFVFALMTLLSLTWAPISGNAYHAGQRTVLYAGALLAATLLLGGRPVRAAEPALAAGILVVVGYGISERLLPGLLHFQQSVTAGGRLEQPLTYWNAMGELAAIGVVMSVRVAGDISRGHALRAAGAAAGVPLCLGLYLSFSRGALFACFSGLVVLIVLAPTREQLRSLLIIVCAGFLAVGAASPFKGVTALIGSHAARAAEGGAMLAALLVMMAATAILQRKWAAGEVSQKLALPRRSPLIALALIGIALTLAILIGAKERSRRPLSAGATRYVTLQSNRYAYWRVAMRAFRSEPLRGVGAGGWAVWWLRYRPFNEFAQDAHSLPLQTLAELGIVGLALLAAFLASLGWAAHEAYKAAPALAVGPIAGVATYFVHAPLDWDWQMPALTLVALGLAGAMLAIADRATDQRDPTFRHASPPKPRIASTQTAT